MKSRFGNWSQYLALSGAVAALALSAPAMAAGCEGQVQQDGGGNSGGGTGGEPTGSTGEGGFSVVRATETTSSETHSENCTASNTESTATQTSTTAIGVSGRTLGILNNIRNPNTGSSTGSGGSQGQRNRGAGSSADDSALGNAGRLSVFAFDDYSKVDRETTSNGGAYDQKSNTLAVGVDYRLNDSTFIGGSIASSDSDTDFRAILGNSDISTTLLGLHGAKYWGNSFFSVMLALGDMDVDVLRGDGTDFYNSSTSGDFWYADFSYGYEYSYGNGLRVTPMMRYITLSGDVDGYLETSVSGAGTVRDVNDQSIDTDMLTLSVSADYPMPQTWGVLLPNLRLDLISDLSDAYDTSGQALNDVDGSLVSTIAETSDDPDTFAVALAAGASAQFAHGVSAYMLFEKLLAHDFLDRYNFTLGFRYELP